MIGLAPTERQLAYVQGLQRRLRLPDALLDNHCVSRFGTGGDSMSPNRFTSPLTDHDRAYYTAHEAIAQRFIRFGEDISDAELAAELLAAYERMAGGPLPPAIAGEVAGTAAALAWELDARRGLGGESWTAHGVRMRERRMRERRMRAMRGGT